MMNVTFSYRLILVFSVFALLLACSSSPQKAPPQAWAKGDYQPAIRYLEDTLQTELDIGDIVGLSVALIDDQNIVWQQGFGYSDIDADRYTDTNSRYRTGTVTQMFTAIAIMQLVEEGKISLDQPLQEILPEFSVQSRFASIEPITLRNLLSHHAGLPSDLLGGRNLAFNEILPVVADMNLSFAPNQIMANSNIGYSLLGQVIETVSGQSYSSYMTQQVFEPLGMSYSSIEANYSGAAYREGGQVVEPLLRDTPSGGLVASASDLAQLTKLIHREGDGLLSHQSVEELLRVQNSERALDLGNRTGLGWNYFQRILPSSAAVVGKRGIGYAHRCIVLTSLEHRFSVVLLSNTAEADESLKRLATDAMHYGLAAKNGTYPDLYAQREYPRANPLALNTRELAEQIQGDYASIAGLVQIEREGRKLAMQTLGRELDLVAGSAGSVKPEYRLMGMSFTLPGDYSMMNIYPQAISGRELLIGDIEGEKILLGEKIERSAYPSSLASYFGRWVPAEPAATVIVEIAGIEIHDNAGYLTSSLSTTSGTTLHYPLQALGESVAVAMGVGPQLGEYFRFYTEQGRPRLNYSGLVFKPESEGLTQR